MEKLINFTAQNVHAFYTQLEKAKARLLELCKREIDGVVTTAVSVSRYNIARQEMKQEFPVEVIGMLDASGFINEILSEEEKTWMADRKVGRRTS